MTPQFTPFPKIPRWSKEVIITEKLDGTNASVLITEQECILVGSRNRWITPQDDNYGFAKWVQENYKEILRLGPGHHFGEWWGKGIQRGYGLKERRFSLFNVSRWSTDNLPDCVGVVPTLWQGELKLDNNFINEVMENLLISGSKAAPGFMNPEGIIIFHTGSNTPYKKTFENDQGKWKG